MRTPATAESRLRVRFQGSVITSYQPDVGVSSGEVGSPLSSARSLPALMCGMDGCRLSKATWTWPARRSVSMGAEPRYGTCCMLTPVISLNSSPDMWIDVPVPDDAMLILPGLALA